jgi:hypothetical protein
MELVELPRSVQHFSSVLRAAADFDIHNDDVEELMSL